MSKKSTQDVTRSIESQFIKWKLAAWTFPFVAISTIAFLHIFRLEHWLDSFFVLMGIFIVSIMVYWWWWAIFTINTLARSLITSGDRLDEIKEEVHNIREELDVDKPEDK